MKSLLFIILLIPLCLSQSIRKALPSLKSANFKVGDSGEPLFLTPYIENGKIDEGQRLSKVVSLPNAPNITSYAGFLTVNKKFNSNIFFWFFPALKNPKTAPILLWLQGGPGASSLFGLFVENGPLILDKNLKASLREFSWAQEFSLIFIDQPVGTGFSFTDNDKGYATNEDDVARDLFEALQQFFTLYPDYSKNDFYVTGESYAGKYVPAIAHKIFTEKDKAKMNMKGIAIGDGLCDPITMIDYGDYLFQIGLLDEKQRNFFRVEQDKARKFIMNGKYYDAFKIFDFLLNGDLINTTSYFTNVTGLSYYFNFLYTSQPEEFSFYPEYLALSDTRKAIHVGNLTYSEGNAVEKHLLNDIMNSVKPLVAELMNNYKVLIYSGQLDIIVAAPLTESFVKSIKWKHSNEYLDADRLIWKVTAQDKEVAGYVRQVHDFYQVIVRNAGHMVPYDQPRVSFDMIKRFIYNNSFNNKKV